jgi:hypothetical protein
MQAMQKTKTAFFLLLFTTALSANINFLITSIFEFMIGRRTMTSSSVYQMKNLLKSVIILFNLVDALVFLIKHLTLGDS